MADARPLVSVGIRRSLLQETKCPQLFKDLGELKTILAVLHYFGYPSKIVVAEHYTCKTFFKGCTDDIRHIVITQVATYL